MKSVKQRGRISLKMTDYFFLTNRIHTQIFSISSIWHQQPNLKPKSKQSDGFLHQQMQVEVRCLSGLNIHFYFINETEVTERTSS